jgi:hypothetical protein
LIHTDYLVSLLGNENRLDTLQILRSSAGRGHILLYNTLAIGHKKHPGEQRVSSWPFAVRKLRGSNRQVFVFIRPPGIARGAFELRMDDVWFCKLLLLFEIVSKTDAGLERHACVFLSVMEEYTGVTGYRKPGI